VPEFRWIFDFSNRGLQQLRRERAKVPEIKDLLTSDIKTEKMKYTDTKMRLHQQSHKKDLEEYRRQKNVRKKRNNN
jgi:hypothetical protein